MSAQGLVKGAKLCFRYPYFYFWHGESTSTASQLNSPASQKSKDLNKVSLLLQDLGLTFIISSFNSPSIPGTLKKSYLSFAEECLYNTGVHICYIKIVSFLWSNEDS